MLVGRYSKGFARAFVLAAVGFAVLPILLFARPAQSGGDDMPAAVKAIFDSKPCFTCHKLGDKGQGVLAPNLRYVGDRRSKSWMKKWIADPPAMKKGTIMPAGQLTSDEIDIMVAYLAKQKNYTNVDRIFKANKNDLAGAGKALWKARDCGTCHKVDGAGGNAANTAPDLGGESSRRTDDWLKTWLKNPDKVIKGTFMPNFKFSEREIDALVAYIKTL
jgi:mono/diheme cytochrome c family protein